MYLFNPYVKTFEKIIEVSGIFQQQVEPRDVESHDVEPPDVFSDVDRDAMEVDALENEGDAELYGDEEVSK